jgi:hypothetical protein
MTQKIDGSFLLGGTVTEQQFEELVSIMVRLLGSGLSRQGRVKFRAAEEVDLINAEQAFQHVGLSVCRVMVGTEFSPASHLFRIVDQTNYSRVTVSRVMVDSTGMPVVSLGMLAVMPTSMTIKDLLGKINIPTMPDFEIKSCEPVT